MNLQEKVALEIEPALVVKYKLPRLALPRITKVTVSSGVGKIKESKDEMENVAHEMAIIVGQKPKATVAKVSISGFKLRKGQVVGFAATLRGKKMFDFIERVINIVLPRSREFEGIELKSFDQNGNFSIAIKEQMLFPEIKADEIKQNWGMGITFSISNTSNKEILMEYLKAMGFIFKKEQ